MIRKIAILFVLFLNISLSQTIGRPTLNNELHNRLSEIRQKHNLPALAGAIVTSNGLLVYDAVGVRKLGSDIPVTRDDKWHLGSNTKAMTATLIAALVEQGKLKWETTLEQVFPELAETMTPALRNVTILQLLSHYSGVTGNINWWQFTNSGTVTEQRFKALKSIMSDKLNSQPGTQFGYSNLGYVIAGAVIEKVTKDSWENSLNKLIFQPLEMKSVGFGVANSPTKIDQPWPHQGDGKAVLEGQVMDNPAVLGPAGTVHCTISDWSKYIVDQLRGAESKSALLKTESYQKLHTPPFNEKYSLGWGVTERSWADGTALTHSGSNTFNFAVVWMAPKKDFAVLVCTNQGGDTAARACDEAAGALIQLQLNKK